MHCVDLEVFIVVLFALQRYHNEDAAAMLKRLDFENVFDVNHQHINGDPQHQKNHRVFAPTCIDLCGF